jgi:hypothetical protein
MESRKGGRVRLYKGHYVSGYIFLLLLCILFLTDQVVGILYAYRSANAGTRRRVWGRTSGGARVIGSVGMTIMISVYFHKPERN